VPKIFVLEINALGSGDYTFPASFLRKEPKVKSEPCMKLGTTGHFSHLRRSSSAVAEAVFSNVQIRGADATLFQDAANVARTETADMPGQVTSIGYLRA
jgi:hypothetical protein